MSRSTVSPGEVIGYLREHEIALTWDPAAAALQVRATETAKTVTLRPTCDYPAAFADARPPYAASFGLWRGDGLALFC